MPIEPTDARTLADLLRCIEQGARPRYIHFWGPNPRVPGQIDESCLCNWYPAGFIAGDTVYRTTEHYLMAEKARLFGDEDIRAQILAAETPLEAQTLGRWIANFEEARWRQQRVSSVIDGNLCKFRQNPALSLYLRKTAPCVLVETSPWDAVWGVGLDRTSPKASDPLQWKGLNLLGFALMEVRERLCSESV
jgi:ribA/ribD-fused uncharacterized protein